MVDYRAALYDPIYATLGVPVVLTLAGGSVFGTITALDKTSGVDVGEQGAQVQTIRPAAAMRVYELAAHGIAVTELPNASLLMDGFTWTVTSIRARPSPKGENDGEVWLLLAGKIPA